MNWTTKDSTRLVFWQCQVYFSREYSIHNCCMWPSLVSFVQNMFWFCRVCKWNLSSVLWLLYEKNGFSSKYPSRCGTDGQNMFFRQGAQISWTAWSCVLCSVTPPGTQHDWKIWGSRAVVPENKPTLSPLDSAAHHSKQERDQGKGSATCSQSWDHP